MPLEPLQDPNIVTLNDEEYLNTLAAIDAQLAPAPSAAPAPVQPAQSPAPASPADDPFLAWYHGAPPMKLQSAPLDAPAQEPPQNRPDFASPAPGEADQAALPPGVDDAPDARAPQRPAGDPAVAAGWDLGGAGAVGGLPGAAFDVSAMTPNPNATPFDSLAAPPTDAAYGALQAGLLNPATHGEPMTVADEMDAVSQLPAVQQLEYLDGLRRRREEHEQQLRDRVDLEHEQKRLENERWYADRRAESRARAQRLEEDAKRIADTEIDTRWNASFGQRVAGVIAAILGGLVQHQNGGRNLGLEAIDKAIDRQIDAQKAKLANQRAELARRGASIREQMEFDDHEFDALERTRQAANLYAQKAVLSEMGKYDQRSSSVMRLMPAYQALQAQQAQNVAAAEQRDFERKLKVHDAWLKEQELRLKGRDQLLKEQLAALKLKGAGGPGKLKPRPEPDTYPAWLKKSGNPFDDAAAKGAYQAYRRNVELQQAEWERQYGARARGGSTPSAPTPNGPSSASSSTSPLARGATPQASGKVAKASAPAQIPDEPSTVPADATSKLRYENKDAWFASNAPTTQPDERSSYWFVDGKNGSEVAPIYIGKGDDAQKFQRRYRIRRQMAIKADKLLKLNERLEKKGLWSKVKAQSDWTSDDDVKEAKALWTNLQSDVLIAKEMGVPSGNDIERVIDMMGSQPGSWKNPIPALQSMRESMQDETDADWNAYAPEAADDPAYNRYRVLPTADAAWVKKLEGRGKVKVLAPEYANTDPKQLDAKPLPGDAPNVVTAKASEEFERNSKIATEWLEDSGAVASAEADLGAAQLGVGTSSKGVNTPQERDYKYSGQPAGADAFATLRTQYVNSVANLNEYRRTQDPKSWKAFQQNQKLIIPALGEVMSANDKFYEYVPAKKRMSWTEDPDLVAHLVGVVLRNGGK